MKTADFVYDYAQFRKTSYLSHPDVVKAIDNYVSLVENGYITITECMYLIANFKLDYEK